MKIAICTDAEAFLQNRIFDSDLASKFPGAEFMSELAKIANRQDIEIVTGDVALSHIKAGDWQPKDVLCVVEADSKYGIELLEFGCVPQIILCFESPIFAWPFYDMLRQIAPKFKHRILFRGAFGKFQTDYGFNHPALFPIFHRDMIFTTVPWGQRKNVVLVAGNKHWKKSNKFPVSLKPGKYLKWWRKVTKENKSSTLKESIDNELQSRRLEIIEFFAGQNKIDIFGNGWQNLSKLPPDWQKRLSPIVGKLNPRPCDNKIETIKNYKFAVCFENVAYPGYITEKIIDCFAAGVIPIYLGAPDIADFIPKEAFIDMRQFDDFSRLDRYLENLTEMEANKIIAAGQDFLKLPVGDKYSFESSAEFMFKLLFNDKD